MKRRLIAALLLSLSSAIVVIALFQMKAFESIELKTLDLRFQLFAQPERANKDIVMVMIDEKSLEYFSDNRVPWPWPRDFYAKLVQYLHRGGAKAVVFDILFADNDIDRLSTTAEQTDGEFAAEMQKAGNVILGVHLRNDQLLLGGASKNFLERHNDVIVEPSSARDSFPSFPTAVLPIGKFQEVAHALGVVDYHEDADGICRRLFPLSLYQNEILPQLGFSAYLLGAKTNRIEVRSNNSLHIGDLDVPLDDLGRFVIFWYGKGGTNGCFQYLSISNLIKSAIDEEANKQPNVPSSYFKDKYVFVGSNAAGLFDLKNTPFTVYDPYPGTEIHATLLSNLLQRDFLVHSSSNVTLIAIVAFCLMISFLFLLVPKVRYVIFVSIILCVGWAYASAHLFQQDRIILDFVAPEVSILCSFLLASVVSYQTETRARKQLRSTFARYLSPVVLAEVIEKSDTVELGGKELRGTVLFSDIKDFTSISEQMPAPELVRMLNEYFSVSTDVILRYEGLLDKYLGDAIMAIFGAPLTTSDHALKACTAALELRQLARERKLGTGTERMLECRIGVNSGTMVVGNIGSDRRLDYTAIGDTVNLASRLEGVNKIFGTEIIIGMTTFQDVGNAFVVRELDILRVKGKKDPVTVYELVGKQGEVTLQEIDLINKFQEGLLRYRERAFDKAVDSFRRTLSSFPHDGPSGEYLRRCQEFLRIPPAKDWSGVFTIEHK